MGLGARKISPHGMAPELTGRRLLKKRVYAIVIYGRRFWLKKARHLLKKIPKFLKMGAAPALGGRGAIVGK